MRFRERREVTDFDGILETENGEHSVKVQNVTMNGLRLRGLKVVVRNPEATLIVRNNRLRGTIRWGKDDDVGFELDQPLTPDQRAMLLRRTRGPVGRTSRPGWQARR